jgi:twinkle protein
MINVRNGIEVLDIALKEMMNPIEGIKVSDWPKFSEYTGGLRMNEFTIFCGSTGSGKTQWLANLAMQLIKQKIKLFIAPVETGDSDFAKRMISVEANCDLNTGEKIPVEKFMQPVKRSMDFFHDNVWFSSHDNRVTIDEMISTLTFLQETKGMQVAILDNLNFFLEPVKGVDQNLENDRVIHQFVMLAKKIPIHIILVMHPKKTDGGKILSEFDIKGSSTAVQEASNVLIMNRPSDKEIEEGAHPFSREFCFRKIRKKGFYVGRKYTAEYRNGIYIERGNETGTGKTSNSGNTPLRQVTKNGLPYID